MEDSFDMQSMVKTYVQKYKEAQYPNIYDFDKFENEDFDIHNDVFAELRELHTTTYTITDKKYEDCKFIVRISGCGFKDIMKYLQAHESLIHDCFIETTNDLIEKYNAQCGWTMGDNILLFFDYSQNTEDPIVWNTETIVTQIASYATIRFDKHLNNNIDKLVETYNVEIIADLIEQDPVFRSILITPKNQEDIIEYIDYIINRTQTNDEQCDHHGTIIKPFVNEKGQCGCAYKKITEEDADKMFTVDFLTSPYIEIIKGYTHIPLTPINEEYEYEYECVCQEKCECEDDKCVCQEKCICEDDECECEDDECECECEDDEYELMCDECMQEHIIANMRGECDECMCLDHECDDHECDDHECICLNHNCEDDEDEDEEDYELMCNECIQKYIIANMCDECAQEHITKSEDECMEPHVCDENNEDCV